MLSPELRIDRLPPQRTAPSRSADGMSATKVTIPICKSFYHSNWVGGLLSLRSVSASEASLNSLRSISGEQITAISFRPRSCCGIKSLIRPSSLALHRLRRRASIPVAAREPSRSGNAKGKSEKRATGSALIFHSMDGRQIR